MNVNNEKNNVDNYGDNNNLNLRRDAISDSEYQLIQISNITERTKFLLKKNMDEYPSTEDNNFFNSFNSQSQKKNE